MRLDLLRAHAIQPRLLFMLYHMVLLLDCLSCNIMCDKAPSTHSESVDIASRQLNEGTLLTQESPQSIMSSQIVNVISQEKSIVTSQSVPKKFLLLNLLRLYPTLQSRETPWFVVILSLPPS